MKPRTTGVGGSVTKCKRGRSSLHLARNSCTPGMRDKLIDEGKSPLQNVYDEELRARVETELKALSEPYRTTVILRDIEELSYEQIAEVMQTSLGTVKSRLVRGREALRKRLERHLEAFGLDASVARDKKRPKSSSLGGQEIEVMP